MSTIVVTFQNLQEARQVMDRLSAAGLGEVRSRILDNSKPRHSGEGDASAAVIDPDLGSIEVRPSETPIVPDAYPNQEEDESSANIPVSGGDSRGIQVLFEFDDQYADQVRKILSPKQGRSGEQFGE